VPARAAVDVVAQARNVRCGYADMSAMDERRVFRGWCVDTNPASAAAATAAAANTNGAYATAATATPLLAPFSLSLAVHLGFSTLLQTGKRKHRNGKNDARRLRYRWFIDSFINSIYCNESFGFSPSAIYFPGRTLSKLVFS
jgi:hypothetical protein